MASASGMNDLLYAAVFGVAAPQGPERLARPGNEPGAALASDGVPPVEVAPRWSDCFLAGWEQYGLRHDY